MVELLKGKRQVGRRTIGVNRADMSVAGSKQTMANVAMNFSNAAYQRAAENSQRDAKKDAMSLTSKELVVQDPVTGKYRNTLKDIIASAKERRGTVYQDTFEAYTNKKAMNLFEIELKGKSQEFSIANRANPQGYEQAMTSYLESAFQNFDGEQKGALSEIGFAIVAQGKAVAIDEANRLAQKEREVLLNDQVKQMQDSVLGFVSEASLDMSTENLNNLLGIELPQVISEIIRNNEKLFKDLGVGQERILNSKLLAKNFLASSNAELAKRIFGSIDGNISISRDEILNAVYSRDASLLPDKDISVGNSTLNLQEAFVSIMDVAEQTNSLDELVKSINQADSMFDAVERAERDLKSRNESEANDVAFSDAINSIELFTTTKNEIEANLDNVQNTLQLDEQLKNIKNLINEIEIAENTRIGTTQSMVINTSDANGMKKELFNAVSTTMFRVMGENGVSGDNARIASLAMLTGTVPDNLKPLYKKLPKAVKDLVNSKELQSLSDDMKRSIMSPFVQLSNIAEAVVPSAGTDNLTNILNALKTNGPSVGWTKKERTALDNFLLSQSSNDLKNPVIGPMLKEGHADGRFILEYSPAIGKSEYYDNVVNSVRDGFVPPQIENALIWAFSGNTNVQPRHIVNAVDFINRTQTRLPDGSVYHALNNSGTDMETTMGKYHSAKAIMEIQRLPEGDDFANLVGFLNQDLSYDQLNDMFPRGSFNTFFGSGFGDKEGKPLLDAYIAKRFQGNPVAIKSVQRVMPYYALGMNFVGNNAERVERIGEWLDKIQENHFVSSAGTIPVISTYDLQSYTGKGDSRSFMSLNKVLLNDDQRKAFNVFAEFDADEGIYALSGGRYTFFPEVFGIQDTSKTEIPDQIAGGGGRVERAAQQSFTIETPTSKTIDEIYDLPDIALPLMDTDENPLGLLSAKQIDEIYAKGGPEKAILVAHDMSDSTIGRRVAGEYSSNVVYFAYYIERETNTLKPAYIDKMIDGEKRRVIWQINMKDFLNKLNEPDSQ